MTATKHDYERPSREAVEAAVADLENTAIELGLAKDGGDDHYHEEMMQQVRERRATLLALWPTTTDHREALKDAVIEAARHTVKMHYGPFGEIKLALAALDQDETAEGSTT